MMLAAIDWTGVLESLIAGIPAIIAACGALVYAREGHRQAKNNRAQLQTPSGDPIGHVVERAHDLAAVATITNIGSTRKVGAEPLPVEATNNMEASVRRLNEDENSPVHVNGKDEEEANK